MADTKMIKTIGEHWVCATIARYGWAPALTRDGLERTDILAVGTYRPHRPTLEIQVKTATDRGESTNWLLGTKAQLLSESVHEWFVFVVLPEPPQEPHAFVVPRDHVSAAAWIGWRDWFTDPAAPKGARNTPLNMARVYRSTWQAYEDRWDLLDTPTPKVPVLLPSSYWELAQEERVGLPKEHPWNNVLPQW
jgi:hypothetical protein